MTLSVSSDVAKNVFLLILEPVFNFFGSFYISPLLTLAILLIPLLIFIFLKAKEGPARGFFRFAVGFLIVVYCIVGIREEVEFVQAKLTHIQTQASQ